MGLGRVFRIGVGYLLGVYTGNWAYLAAALDGERQRVKADKAKRRAIQAYNDAQVDRLEMVERDPRQPRTLAYGRVRTVEGVRRWFQTGSNLEKLTLFVSLAGHEIDAIEGWYLNEYPVALDGSGNVLPMSTGTATGYKTNTAGYAIGATSITLTTGTGSIVAGDKIRFATDATLYTVATGIGAPGTVVIAAPGLLKPIPASAVNVTLEQHPFVVISRQVGRLTGTLDGAGAGSVTLPGSYLSGTVSAAQYTGSIDTYQSAAMTPSVAGTTASVSGGNPGWSFEVTYEILASVSYVRIRSLLGTSTQSAYTSFSADYPGKLKTTDAGASIALAVVDCTYNPDVFPQGRPTVTALLRGRKVYDPRKDSTVSGGSGAHRLATPSTWEWSQNPALIAYDYARHAYGWNVPAAKINTADVMVAANFSDTSTVFTIRNPDATTRTVTLPRYRCDIVLSTAGDPAQNMEAILDTMNGRAFWSGGTLRMRAGTLNSTAVAMDSTWFVEEVNSQGQPDGQPVISAAQSITRAQRFNRVAGTFVDADARYQTLPFPAVEDATLVASKGERETEVDLPGVSHVAHAQHLASMAIRAAQAGQRIEARCGVKALALELGDVFSITHSRFGMSAKTYECIGWQWGPDQAVRVQGAEISAALFTVDAELRGKDPAPDSDLRAPWEVETLAGLSVASGTTAVTDSSILTRTVVSWTPATGQNIRAGGQVEVQYWPADTALPSGDWNVWMEQGYAASATIPGLLTNRFYLFRARFVQAPPVVVRGPWAPVVRYQVAARRQTKIFRQTSAPTGDVINGDEWFDTDDGNAYYVRVAGVWTLTQTGTGGLGPEAATKVINDYNDYAGTAYSWVVGSAASTITIRSVAFTPAYACNIEFTGSVECDGTDVSASRLVGWRVIENGSVGPVLDLGGFSSTATRGRISGVGVYAAAAGVPLTFDLYIKKVPFTSGTVTVWESRMRITAVYK